MDQNLFLKMNPAVEAAADDDFCLAVPNQADHVRYDEQLGSSLPAATN